MGIKETPTNIKVYYKSMIDAITLKKEETVVAYNTLVNLELELYNEIKDCKAIYKNEFGVNLDDYNEFTSNKYTTGEFYKIAKGLFINRSNNYKLVSDLFDLFVLAKHQKQVAELAKELKVYNKMLALNLKTYTDIMRIFMTEVHKKIIIEGGGYAFGHNIGWICVNRCVIRNARPKIDYAATKKKEKELKEKGARIYNQEEADWCKRNGIDYKAEDKRVFRTNEYCYEIPLIGCKLPNGSKFKLTIADYRHSSIRGKTNEELIKECKKDINKICELQVDMKTKLTLCDIANKILYTKFIRNENQQPLATRKANRKNR